MRAQQDVRPKEAGDKEIGDATAKTNEVIWKPEDFISDLDESVHFTDENILSWNFPKDWTYKDEIRSKGYLTFRPVKSRLPHIWFEDVSIRMGQVASTTTWDERQWADFFCATCGLGKGTVSVQSTRVMPTRSGTSATILYFSKGTTPCGALAYLSHSGFFHYFALFGGRIQPECSDRSVLGTFHRLVYRYEFSLMKNIMF